MSLKSDAFIREPLQCLLSSPSPCLYPPLRGLPKRRSSSTRRRERQLHRHPGPKGDRPRRPGPSPDGDPDDSSVIVACAVSTSWSSTPHGQGTEAHQEHFRPYSSASRRQQVVRRKFPAPRPGRSVSAADFRWSPASRPPRRRPTWFSTRPASSSSSRCRTPTRSSPSTSKPASLPGSPGRLRPRRHPHDAGRQTLPAGGHHGRQLC